MCGQVALARARARFWELPGGLLGRNMAPAPAGAGFSALTENYVREYVRGYVRGANFDVTPYVTLHIRVDVRGTLRVGVRPYLSF